ncbi:MAG TPA: pyridoxal-dependent decarboxylase [Gaiellales bacterium]|nr:pyridoxal-dependent decarboxylase [Gaiellales bacterium]
MSAEREPSVDQAIADPGAMHAVTPEIERAAEGVFDYARERLHARPRDFATARTPAEMQAAAGDTVTEDGIGADAALRLFAETLAPASVPVENTRFLAFIPTAPTPAAKLFDMALSATPMYAGSWRSSAGSVYAENQALRWLADLAGLPATAGGCFVQGGTVGNLSALVSARHAHRAEHGRNGTPLRVAATGQAHSSVAQALDVMDAGTLEIEPDGRGRMTGAALEAALAADGDGVFAVAATGGTTNLGVIDDLAGIADVCARRGLWLHVDAAYGGAGLAAPSVRPRFDGIERCDSFIVDPHKWLFAPFDSCALLYRKPELAQAAHRQHAGYLDAARVGADWNPSDYAIHLTRRARGLPFWFSLATHGTRAYTEAVEGTLRVAREARAEIERRDYLELANDTDLTVLCIRRVGWTADDYRAWSARNLEDGLALVTPTELDGEIMTRICILNPRTTVEDVAAILDTMA